MGLDMYLNAERFLWSFPEDGEDVKLAKEIARLVGVADCEARDITVKVGYWRKANHIHRWFVDHVQNGDDNCATYDVSREQLAELRKVCQQVLDDKKLASELLPIQEGFFFGGTEYGEWYFEDLTDTIKQIDKALALQPCWDLKYRASW